MPTRNEDELATALHAVLESPNEADRNGETANVVDGLFAIARAIEQLAREMEKARYDRLNRLTRGSETP